MRRAVVCTNNHQVASASEVELMKTPLKSPPTVPGTVVLQYDELHCTTLTETQQPADNGNVECSRKVILVPGDSATQNNNM